MRVVFLDYVLEPNQPGVTGLSDIVWDMAHELVNLGHEVHVVGPYSPALAPDPRVRVHRFAVPPTGYRWFVGHLWMGARMADIAARLSPDIVHAPEYLTTAVFLQRHGGRFPVVLTVPGNIFHKVQFRLRPLPAGAGVGDDQEAVPLDGLQVASGRHVAGWPLGPQRRRLARRGGNPYSYFYTQTLKWAARLSARRAGRVIAISQEMKRWWEWTGSAPEHTPLIPLGVNPRRFQPVQGARAALGLPGDQVQLLYVGRFSREKGLLDLIEALSAVRRDTDLSRVRVVLIGKGPLQADLEAAIAWHGLESVVRLVPWVAQQDLSVWYSASDALLLTSYAEGFGRTVAEAMSCGTPVIGSDVAGVHDHVLGGVRGLTFPVGDLASFTAVLRQALRCPEHLRAMRPATLRYAQAQLQWPALTARMVAEVYTPLLSEART